MKRIVIITVLFAFCVAVSAYSIHHVNDVTDTINASVTRALDALESEDNTSLTREIDQFSDFWNREEDYLIHFVRHTQIDDITKSVARLQPLAAGQDYTELAAELASIRWQMEHINRSERLILSNLL